MINFLRQWMAVDMAIDLGTANTIIYVKQKGIVLNEPSVVAMSSRGNGVPQIREVGQSAKQMLGRAPDNIQVVRPMRDGVIADYRITEQMLNHFIKKVHGAKLLTPGPRIVICVPTSSTPVDRRAIRESALSAGATKVYLLEEPMAAALGCGMPVQEPVGSMIVDIGGGTTEIGVISLGGMVYSKSLEIGGDKIDMAIIDHIRKEMGVAIGEATSERIKKQIAVADESLCQPDQDIKEIQVSGQKVAEGVPRKFTITSHDVYIAIKPRLDEIIKSVRFAMEKIPPELASDISENGLMLTGGGALIAGFDTLIANATGVPVKVAEDPLTCVARGCGVTLDYLDKDISTIFA